MPASPAQIAQLRLAQSDLGSVHAKTSHIRWMQILIVLAGSVNGGSAPDGPVRLVIWPLPTSSPKHWRRQLGLPLRLGVKSPSAETPIKSRHY